MLKIATVFGACQQGTHIQGIHHGFGQNVRHIVLRDAPGQALGNSGLTYTGLTDQQGVVLAAAAQNLNDTLDLVLTADQRINLAFLGQLIQVDRVLLQGR